MKIGYASDLHVKLNTTYYNVSEQDIIDKLNLDGIDLLILGGDTCEYPNNLKFCSKLMKLYPSLKIIEVAGNHLYYSCTDKWLTMSEINNICREFSNTYPNYKFLENESIVIDNVKIIGSTMWTKLGERAGYQMKIQSSLNDFRYILNDKYDKITCSDIVKLHEKSIKYITKEINNCEAEKCIVVTHHAPFFEYYSDISHAFGIDLTTKLRRLKKMPNYWIYGHTHINRNKILMFNKGIIQCLSNQMGYEGESQWSDKFDAWQTYSPDSLIII